MASAGRAAPFDADCARLSAEQSQWPASEIEGARSESRRPRSKEASQAGRCRPPADASQANRWLRATYGLERRCWAVVLLCCWAVGLLCCCAAGPLERRCSSLSLERSANCRARPLSGSRASRRVWGQRDARTQTGAVSSAPDNSPAPLELHECATILVAAGSTSAPAEPNDKRDPSSSPIRAANNRSERPPARLRKRSVSLGGRLGARPPPAGATRRSAVGVSRVSYCARRSTGSSLALIDGKRAQVAKVNTARVSIDLCVSSRRINSRLTRLAVGGFELGFGFGF